MIFRLGKSVRRRCVVTRRERVRGERSATTKRDAVGSKRSAVGEGASGRAREYRLLQCVVVRVSVTVYVCACVRAYVRTV